MTTRIRLLTILGLVALLPAFGAIRPGRTFARPAAKINLGALYYNTREAAYKKPFGAVPAHEHVTFKLRTAHANATAVTLQVSQYDATATKKLGSSSVKMKVSRGSKYDMWKGVFTPTAIGQYAYDFMVQNGSQKAYYSGTGALQGGPGQASRKAPDFQYWLTVYVPGFKAPSWASDAVMYQIFPDRFYDGDTTNDTTLEPSPYCATSVHKNWSDRPIGGCDFFGGDLQGIDDKLPYLKNLGVNVLYLNPIFLAPSNHKYDTSNYMEIDPHFGTQVVFDKLIADAKAMGIRIILDGVFNHTGSDSIYFDRYGQFPSLGAAESKDSPYYSWYHFTHWPDTYDEFPGADSLPTLQEVDPVKDFIFRTPDSVAQHWLSAGTSGWRLDAAQYKSHEWWQEFRQSVKSAYPDSIMICECDLSPINATPWLLGNEMDGDMNYRFRDAILSFFARGAGSSAPAFPSTVKGLSAALMSILEDYPRPAIMSSMNLVDSHDTERILLDVQGQKNVLKEVATLQMTWLGMPEIYYGDEAGLTGNTDPDDRRTFPWDNQDTALEAYYKKIIGIRQAHPALRTGSVTPVITDSNHRTFGFLRKTKAETVGVVINDNFKATRETMPMGGAKNGTAFKDAIGGKTYKVSRGVVTVTLPAHTSVILVKKYSRGTAQGRFGRRSRTSRAGHAPAPA